MIEYRAKIVGDRLETRGIDWGRRGGQPLWPTVIHRVGNVLVVKVHGYTGWICQGQSGHHPSYYCLARVSKPSKDGMLTVTVVRGTEVEPGAKWRAAVRDLIAKAEELGKEP